MPTITTLQTQLATTRRHDRMATLYTLASAVAHNPDVADAPASAEAITWVALCEQGDSGHLNHRIFETAKKSGARAAAERLSGILTDYVAMLGRDGVSAAGRAAALDEAYEPVAELLGDQAAENSIGMITAAYRRTA